MIKSQLHKIVTSTGSSNCHDVLTARHGVQVKVSACRQGERRKAAQSDVQLALQGTFRNFPLIDGLSEASIRIIACIQRPSLTILEDVRASIFLGKISWPCPC